IVGEGRRQKPGGSLFERYRITKRAPGFVEARRIHRCRRSGRRMSWAVCSSCHPCNPFVGGYRPSTASVTTLQRALIRFDSLTRIARVDSVRKVTNGHYTRRKRSLNGIQTKFDLNFLWAKTFTFSRQFIYL